MSEIAFTSPNGFPSSNSFLSILPSDSSLDVFLEEPNPFSLKSSLSNELSLNLEPLEREVGRSDALTVFPTGNLVEEAFPVSLSEQDSLISLGKFGDYDNWEDATLTLEDANGNSAETFSLTGNGYGQVFKDDRSEYVFFWETDETTSVQISARDDLQFNDYIGSSLQVQTQGSITTNNILSNGGTIKLISTGESVTSQGDIATNGGWVKIEGVDVDVVTSQIEASEVTLFANHNLNLEASQLRVSGDLNLSAQNRVQVSDRVTDPFVAKAGGRLTLQGNQSIEIMTLNHPQTSFESGNDLSLVSNGQISGDAHFSSQGNFAVLNLQAEAGQLASFSNPVINTSGNVYLGNYYGAWLAVNAEGSIIAGTINTASGQGNGGSIALTAIGDISTGNLYSYAGVSSMGKGGNITLSSSEGAIDTGTLNASGLTGGGTITITADGNISTENLYSYVGADGTGKGGDITLKSNQGTIDTRAGEVNTSGSTAGGTITFTAAAKLLTEDLNAHAWGDDTRLGGHITLKAGDEITTASLFTFDSGVVDIHLRQDDAAGSQPSPDVTTGDITATQVKILSDGGFTAVGEIKTYEADGDIEIMALKDITVKLIATCDGATHLTSGLGAIAATEAIQSPNGLIALARQDITTNEIQSNQGVVILKTSQGAITVNDTISSYGDVSLAAAKDVVAQEITSRDGGVAMMSAKGTVQANGAISSVEDVTLGASGDVVAQKITAQLGTVALVSTEGSVKANGTLDGGIDVVISAKQDVSAGQILAGAVVVDSEQGAVTLTGDIITGGDSISISASGNVLSQNLISQGGAITVVSEQAAVTTGYLRSDGYGTGGKIYLQAFGYIRVTNSFKYFSFPYPTNYSIYTGNNLKNWITIVSQSSVLKFRDKSKFVIGNASLNGTIAQVSNLISFKNPQDPPSIPLLILEFIKSIFQEIEIPSLLKPTHVEQINPITGERYADEKESELVKKLTPAQRTRLKELVNKYTDKEESLKKEEVRRGKVDEQHGCFSVELDKHLGTKDEYPNHSLYATYITGSTGDYLVITNRGSYAFYDGLVKPSGAIVTPYNFEPVGSVAEVKTQHEWLRKRLSPTSRYYNPQPLTERQVKRFEILTQQINIYSRVALECGLKFFISFDNVEAGRAGRELFEYRTPLVTERPVKVHYVPPRAGLYPPINS